MQAGTDAGPSLVSSTVQLAARSSTSSAAPGRIGNALYSAFNSPARPPVGGDRSQGHPGIQVALGMRQVTLEQQIACSD